MLAREAEEDKKRREEELAREAAEEADGVMAKLFHPTRRSPPSPPHLQPQPQNQPHRPRAPTSEKLEKYKFMLINIEQDPDILDPGTFALMQESTQDSSSYMGFEFNDYPAEVLCPPFQPTTQHQGM